MEPGKRGCLWICILFPALHLPKKTPTKQAKQQQKPQPQTLNKLSHTTYIISIWQDSSQAVDSLKVHACSFAGRAGWLGGTR